MKSAMIIMLAMLALMPAVASAIPYAGQAYSASRPSYYGQYNYNANYNYHFPGYMPAYYGGRAGSPFHYGTGNPLAYHSSDCSVLLGCRQVQTSHIYVHNALDSAYYSNPGLLSVRHMDNQYRYHGGFWPQAFNY